MTPWYTGARFSLLAQQFGRLGALFFSSTKAFQSSGVLMPHLRNGLRPCCTYCIFNSLFQSLKHLFAVFMTHFLTSGLIPLGTLNHLIQLSKCNPCPLFPPYANHHE